MGDGVTDDKDLVVRLGGEQAGGVTGQLILSDVTFTIERDNTEHTGIGNEEAQAKSYGDPEASLSAEGMVNDALAREMKSLYDNKETPPRAYIRSQGTFEWSIGKMDWNSLETSASDDGDVTMSLDAGCRELEPLGPNDF